MSGHVLFNRPRKMSRSEKCKIKMAASVIYLFFCAFLNVRRQGDESRGDGPQKRGARGGAWGRAFAWGPTAKQVCIFFFS